MNKSSISIFLLALCFLTLSPYLSMAQGGGMWPLFEVTGQAESLKAEGFKLPATKLYDGQKNGLNNAVVLFGGGCTASFISEQGLILTNHHCGYGAAQRLSTTEKNFLTDGFWAKNRGEEIPSPGTTVTISRKVTNVSDYILKHLGPEVDEVQRQKIIQGRIEALTKAYQKNFNQQVSIKPFYGGNEYWLTVEEIFKDVRLVAFPPNGIGKFGADIDNWTWPRMTGDFSVFRVYASRDNRPAEYNKNNRPYIPDQSFKIATSGYKEGDFALVYGYPYLTEEYLTSYELERVTDIMYPIRTSVREKKLAVWDSAMRSNPDLFLKYAAKQASVSNGYKKWVGALQGLADNQVLEKKKNYELRFARIAALSSDTSLGLLLPKMAAAVTANRNALIASEYILEAVLGVELVKKSEVLEQMLQLYRHGGQKDSIASVLAQLKSGLPGFYKNYDAELDQKVFEALMPLYMKQQDQVVPSGLRTQFFNAGNRYDLWAASVFSGSLLIQTNQLYELLDEVNPHDTLIIKKDPAFAIYHEVLSFYRKNMADAMRQYQNITAPLHRQFVAVQRATATRPNEIFPDANQSLRIAYGKVKALPLSESNKWQTTLGDMMPRHQPEVEELTIPQKLRDLYQKKDFGRWAANKEMPVNFITTSHTSGGNSGSPVLNDKGQLIGLNFDRPWQGTMSDFYYSDKVCRNISVDIRYVLFIIEKFGDAGWLLKEMNFAK